MLTVSAYPTRTSVVLRGKYLLENVLNAPPPPPPPDVPALNEAAVGVANSLRQQMEAHRADAFAPVAIRRWIRSASALRTTMPVGNWRTQDGKFPIDSTGSLSQRQNFNGPARNEDAAA